ncbi:MAG: isopentenyl-diphosphate Delta-isomerase [Clostridia bacterium]|nr:isopentenyl-diphosphate Delta-isomerase [Clostridia bacterium]
MKRDKVVVVDEKDVVLGEMEKMEAHYKGALHRAFSIIILNENGEMLLQQRALSKYHSPGLWTNACCSHPQLNESYRSGAEERLMAELGFTVSLLEVHHFIYKARFDNGLTEHEFDRVFLGTYNGNIAFNKDEVEAIKWVSLEQLYADMQALPHHYTEWFKILMTENKRNKFI